MVVHIAWHLHWSYNDTMSLEMSKRDLVCEKLNDIIEEQNSQAKAK